MSIGILGKAVLADFVLAAGLGTDDVTTEDTLVFTEVASATVENSNASDSLTLSDTAEVTSDVSFSSDAIALTDTATAGGVFNSPAVDTLTPSESATAPDDLTGTADDTLSFFEDALVPPDASTVGADDTLTLTEMLFSEVIAPAEDSLTISDTVDGEAVMVADDSLTMSESATVQAIYFEEFTHVLSESEEVYNVDTGQIEIVQTGLSDAATLEANPVLADATDTVTFAENSESGTDFGNVGEFLLLIESAGADVTQATNDDLDLSDSASATVEFGDTEASDTLTLSEGVAICSDTDGIECRYDPFIGTNTSTNYPGPPPATYVGTAADTGFRLKHVATSDEVVLRKPNFGDKHRISSVRINHETRNGKLIVYADQDWPVVETRLFTFSSLRQAKAAELQDFMADHLGLEIRLIDYEDREWVGVITEVDDPIVQDNRCGYTASFTFEGELV